MVYLGEVQMPNITGKSLDEAIQVLKNNSLYNFHISTVDGSSIWVKSNWTVSSQNVSAGSIIKGDTSINLVCKKNNSTSSAQKTNQPSSPKPNSVNDRKYAFTTNDKTTYKNGNSGKYAYSYEGEDYLFFIIDFDEGYVYSFDNSDISCTRVKIVQGDLNSVVIITYHDGDTVWSYGLHFKYKGFPDHLIVQEETGFEWDYYPTSLEEALKIRDTKEIEDL